MSARFIVINQARMTSTRLPGKVLKTVLGKPLLEYQIERIARSRLVDGHIVATTVNATDEPIVALCARLGLPIFRGSELDVLGRYHGASQLMPSENYIRITSDCPLMDPAIIDLAIEQFLRSGVDYLSNSKVFPLGMGIEIFRGKMLAEATAKGVLPYEREHVTPYFYTRPEKFKLGQVELPEPFPAYRLTVDTAEDFLLIQTLLERLVPSKPEFSLMDICAELDRDPALANLNKNVRQKKYDE